MPWATLLAALLSSLAVTDTLMLRSPGVAACRVSSIVRLLLPGPHPDRGRSQGARLRQERQGSAAAGAELAEEAVAKKGTREKIKLGKRNMKNKYDDKASIAQYSFVPEKY